MFDNQVVVKTFGTEVEAEMDRTRLEAAGIPAMVTSDDCGGMRPHLAYTLGVKLIVPQEQEAQAREVLDEPPAPDGALWLCPSCREENEAAYEVCWNCQAERPGSPASQS